MDSNSDTSFCICETKKKNNPRCKKKPKYNNLCYLHNYQTGKYPCESVIPQFRDKIKSPINNSTNNHTGNNRRRRKTNRNSYPKRNTSRNLVPKRRTSHNTGPKKRTKHNTGPKRRTSHNTQPKRKSDRNTESKRRTSRNTERNKNKNNKKQANTKKRKSVHTTSYQRNNNNNMNQDNITIYELQELPQNKAGDKILQYLSQKQYLDESKVKSLNDEQREELQEAFEYLDSVYTDKLLEMAGVSVEQESNVDDKELDVDNATQVKMYNFMVQSIRKQQAKQNGQYIHTKAFSNVNNNNVTTDINDNNYNNRRIRQQNINRRNEKKRMKQKIPIIPKKKNNNNNSNKKQVIEYWSKKPLLNEVNPKSLNNNNQEIKLINRMKIVIPLKLPKGEEEYNITLNMRDTDNVTQIKMYNILIKLMRKKANIRNQNYNTVSANEIYNNNNNNNNSHINNSNNRRKITNNTEPNRKKKEQANTKKRKSGHTTSYQHDKNNTLYTDTNSNTDSNSNYSNSKTNYFSMYQQPQPILQISNSQPTTDKDESLDVDRQQSNDTSIEKQIEDTLTTNITSDTENDVFLSLQGKDAPHMKQALAKKTKETILSN